MKLFLVNGFGGLGWLIRVFRKEWWLGSTGVSSRGGWPREVAGSYTMSSKDNNTGALLLL